MSKDNHKVARICGPGWDKILAPVLKELNRLDFTVMEVKEKFGKLRVSYDESFDSAITDEVLTKVRAMVDEAEEKSGHVCELCGEPGKMMESGHWLKTLCIWHAKELGYNKFAN